MKQELIAKLDELVKSEDILDKSHEIKEVIQEFKNLNRQRNAELFEQFIEDGGKKEDFSAPKDELDRKLDDLIQKFNERKDKAEKQKAEEEHENYIKKLEIIEQIKHLTEQEDNIGKARSSFNELQEKWKAIGNVSAKKYKDLQAAYSAEIEKFYYNIKIFREILDYDRRKNGDMKAAIISKIKDLAEKTDIREVESLLKVYRNEWDEIGPTEEDKWQTLRKDFHDALDTTYDKIKGHYKNIKEELDKRHEIKKELLKAVKEINEIKNETIKSWMEMTDKVIEIQKKWREAGHLAGKEFEQTWEDFKHSTDLFFENKSKYFEDMREKQNAIKQVKRDLIQKANDLKDSIDWKNTTEKLIDLQKKWKNSGILARKEEQKLWLMFREACDHFFNAKKAHFEGVDAQFEGNLELKTQLIEKLNAFNLSGNFNDDKKALIEFQKEWASIGFVPMKNKAEITKVWFNRIDHLFESINASVEEKAMLKYHNKIDSLAHSENPKNSLTSEYNDLGRKIQELSSDVIQYENNLGFFANSKGADAMKKEVQQKIEKGKRQIAELKQKQNAIKKMIDQL